MGKGPHSYHALGDKQLVVVQVMLHIDAEAAAGPHPEVTRSIYWICWIYWIFAVTTDSHNHVLT